MTRYASLSIALLLAAPAAAQDQPQQPPPTTQSSSPQAASGEAPPGALDSQANPKGFDLAREKVADCPGQKFVFAWGVGAHPTKVTLCGDKDASTDELVRMIGDAADKIEATTSIPDDRRTALVQQMRAKISELQGALPGTAAPAAKPAQVAETPAVSAPAPVESAPAPVQVAVAPPSAAAPAVAAVSPRLSFACINAEFPGGGPCVTLDRDTIVTVKSAGGAPGGFALRFVRQGDVRAEVALGSMRKGQSVRVALPRQVCSGMVTGEVEFDVVGGGQVVDRQGPFLIRC